MVQVTQTLSANSVKDVEEVTECKIRRHLEAHPFDSQPFIKIFSSKGGKLKHWSTDDSLLVPEGAIPDGEVWKIRSQVITSLEAYAYRLLDERIRFVSCIWNSERVDNNCKEKNESRFSRPVVITIHHTVPMRQRLRSNKGTIGVLCFTDENAVHPVSEHSDGSMQDSYFIPYEDYVEVHTTHFSKYVVISTSPDGEPSQQILNISDVQLFVYGKIEQMNVKRKLYQTHLEVYLLVSMENNSQMLPGMTKVNNYI